MSAEGELLLMGVRVISALIEAAARGDLAAKARLVDILGPGSESYAQRLIDEAAIAAKFGHV